MEFGLYRLCPESYCNKMISLNHYGGTAMNIGIVVYSQTGNTLAVVQQLRDKLKAQGHTVAIERITLASDPKDAKNIRLNSLPGLREYDALVFAAPVQGFQLCPPMRAYLMMMPPLMGRKAAVLVTKHWASGWTGGSSAIKEIGKAIEANGGRLAGEGFIGWKSKRREWDIEELTESIAARF